MDIRDENPQMKGFNMEWRAVVFWQLERDLRRYKELRQAFQFGEQLMEQSTHLIVECI